jgi:hypothetical protein
MTGSHTLAVYVAVAYEQPIFAADAAGVGRPQLAPADAARVHGSSPRSSSKSSRMLAGGLSSMTARSARPYSILVAGHQLGLYAVGDPAQFLDSLGGHRRDQLLTAIHRAAP